MTRPKFDQEFWDQLWSNTLRDHADRVALRAPNAHLTTELADVAPGCALDAGCGHGAETLWLAARGWQVTAVDFSRAALTHARSMVEAAGAEVADRVEWVEGDLATWTAEPERYDLVVCLYVHVAGSVDEMVTRMAKGVAPGGTLFLVGHRPIDPSTGVATAAANQVQVSVEAAVRALAADEWDCVVAEERPRAIAGTGVDAVIRARRRLRQESSPMTSMFHESSRRLQDRFDTRRLADRIESRLVTDAIDDESRRFIESVDMFFLATVDDRGMPNCSYKGGAPGFVRVVDAHTIAFPNYDGNGMYLSMGNIGQNPNVGLLFIDFERGNRLRLNGAASIADGDPLMPEYPEAQFIVRVRAHQVFPNCPRYVHKMQRIDSSCFVPRGGCQTPVPEWKRSAWAHDALPEQDPARDPSKPSR